MSSGTHQEDAREGFLHSQLTKLQEAKIKSSDGKN